MALPTSGNLSLSQVIAEFGGGTKLRDFFRGGGAGGGVFGGNQGARGGDGGALAISEYSCVGGQTIESVVGPGVEEIIWNIRTLSMRASLAKTA